jgi:hypothetical protein
MAVIHPDGSTSSLEVDFALALLSGIESAKKHPAQLRHIVYELARLSLERLPQWLQLTSSKPPSLSRLIRRRTEAPNRSTKESAMMMARVIIECSHH